MALSKTQEALVKLLPCCNLTSEGARIIAMIIEIFKKEEQMLDWLLEQKEAPTENELLVKALEMCGIDTKGEATYTA